MVDPFRTAVPFRSQTAWNLTGSFRQRGLQLALKGLNLHNPSPDPNLNPSRASAIYLRGCRCAEISLFAAKLFIFVFIFSFFWRSLVAKSLFLFKLS